MLHVKMPFVVGIHPQSRKFASDSEQGKAILEYPATHALPKSTATAVHSRLASLHVCTKCKTEVLPQSAVT